MSAADTVAVSVASASPERESSSSSNSNSPKQHDEGNRRASTTAIDVKNSSDDEQQRKGFPGNNNSATAASSPTSATAAASGSRPPSSSSGGSSNNNNNNSSSSAATAAAGGGGEGGIKSVESSSNLVGSEKGSGSTGPNSPEEGASRTTTANSTMGLTIAPGAKRTISVKSLYGAALHGKEETVQQILETRGKEDLENAYKDGTTPLFAAVNPGHEEIVKMLIEAGADVNATAKNGATPLCFAASKGHTKILEMLLEAGATQEGVEVAGWGPLHLAVSKGHPEACLALLKGGADPNYPCSSNGHTPVAIAIQSGHSKVLDVLLTKGAKANAPVKGWRPIHIATLTDSLDCTRVLIEHQVKLNLTNSDGVVALFIAAEKDLPAHIELLLEHGAEIEHQARSGATPLWMAVRKGNVEAATALLKAGANTAASVKGWPCLHIAAEQNEPAIIKAILGEVVDTELPNLEGNTALHVACECGSVDAARVLVDCPFIQIDFTNRRRASALCVAAHFGYYEIVELLVKKGANKDFKIGGGWTPILLADDQGWDEIVKFLESSGCKLDSSDKDGLNPLAGTNNNSSSKKKKGDDDETEEEKKKKDDSCCCVQ